MSTHLRISPNWEKTFQKLMLFKQAWPVRGFSWDSRLTCLTSSFNGEYTGEAKAAIALLFFERWTIKSISGAPELLKEVVEESGGLRPNQLVYSAGPALSGLFLYGLWWPWEDQETVSFRLGFAKLEADDDPYPRLRELFKVTIHS